MQQVQETHVRFLGQEDPLEEGMATHSSTLAGKIPWTGKPGRIHSMGSQGVRHDLEPEQHSTLYIRTKFLVIHGPKVSQSLKPRSFSSTAMVGKSRSRVQCVLHMI